MDEAGEIVAAPGIFYQIVFLNPNRLDVFKITFLRLAINMIMAALPNLNRQIRRYERHKKALDQAGQLLYL